jgi:hypothetical protein
MEGHYQAAVCRRGHVIDCMIEPRTGRSEPIPERCSECGAKALIECPACSSRLQGMRVGVVVFEWEPKPFCFKCGSPMPWATREQMALHIENLLDEQPDLQPGDRRALEEQLASFSETPDPATEKRQIAAAEKLRVVAPRVFQLAMPILQAVLTAEAKQKLGLPPV